jgi:thymidylate kinase
MSSPTAPAGRFVVFEGGEGSGKSTQAARLAHRLGAVLTREPGGTAIGAALRAVLLDARTTGLDDRAEALLMAADRAQHVAEVVRPALAAGRHVVSDRYVGSTLAYHTRASGGGCRSTTCAGCPAGPQPAWCPTWWCSSMFPGSWARPGPPVVPIRIRTASRRQGTGSTTG